MYGSWAKHVRTGVLQARVPEAPLFAVPDATVEKEKFVYFGHRVDVLGVRGEFLHVNTHLDGYEGFVLARDFGPPTQQTHWISGVLVNVRAGLRVQTHTLMNLWMNSLVRVIRSEGKFVELDGLGWVSKSLVCPIGSYEWDHVAVMLRFLNYAYEWAGLDCSGLMQHGLLATGVPIPRNTSQQLEYLGEPVEIASSLLNLHRGDLVFWKGHVVCMVDDFTAVHATDNVMHVIQEPLFLIAERFKEEEGKPILGIRRLPNYRKRELGLK